MINSFKVVTSIASVIILLASTNASAKDWFVSPQGSGTVGSEGEPLGSIQTAFEQAAPGDTIYLRAGRYHESVVTGGKSGTEGAPIILTNFEDEHIIIDGSDPF